MGQAPVCRRLSLQLSFDRFGQHHSVEPALRSEDKNTLSCTPAAEAAFDDHTSIQEQPEWLPLLGHRLRRRFSVTRRAVAAVQVL